MKLSKPPNCDYDSDLASWLLRMSVLANKEGNVIEVDTVTPEVKIHPAVKVTDDISGVNGGVRLHAFGNICGYGFVCRTGYGGTIGANVFNFQWTGTALAAYADNTYLGEVTLTSDYRLKQQVKALDISAMDRIMKLKPVVFRWRDVDIFKDDGKEREGFLAHEVQTVIPSAASGTKDEEKDGKARYQALNSIGLLPTIVKGMQELSAENDARKLEITALQKQVEDLTKQVEQLIKKG